MTENYTKIPNVLIDKYMPLLRPAEFVVLIAIARKTVGWHKKSDMVAISTIILMTGLSKNSVKKSLKNLKTLGIISQNTVAFRGRYAYEYAITSELSGSQIDPQYNKRVSEFDPHEGHRLTLKTQSEGQNLTPQKKSLNKYKEKGGFGTPSKENQASPPDSRIQNESNGTGEKSNVIYFEQVKKTNGELKMEKTEKEWKPNVPDWLREKVESPEGAERLSETEKKFRAMGAALPAKSEPIVNHDQQQYAETLAREFVDKMRDLKEA
jgi:phage replication O-like protein O